MKAITLSNLHDVYKVKLMTEETAILKGYELIEELFVDSSGFGSESEPALTRSGFERELEKLLKKHGKLHACITRAGQFQVYIGLFKKTGKKISKRIDNNTLEIDYHDSTAIRLLARRTRADRNRKH